MAKEIDEETKEIIVSFVSEGYERLDDSEAQLSKLSDEEDNTPILNSVFRLFHSVKGSAGYLGFEVIKRLTHEAETLLDVFLKEHVTPTQDAIDTIYDTIDVLRTCIGIVEKEYDDSTGSTVADTQTKVLTSVIARLRNKEQEQSEPVEVNCIEVSELVSAEMIERFIGECADLMDRAEKTALSLQAVKTNTEEINDIFRTVHTIKGNSGFFGYSILERYCMDFESFLDAQRKSGNTCSEACINTIIGHIDRIRSLLRTVIVHPPTRELAGDTTVSKARTEADIKQSMQEYKPIGEILVDMGAVPGEVLSQALQEQERPIGEILVEKGVVARDTVEEALKIQRAQKPASEPETSHDIIRKEIRVDTSKLDKLFELVGELITAEAMVINNPDITGLKLDSFNKSFARLNKISREIQETTMMIRMIPLDGLFQKMTRLVRDLSRKCDRPINFFVSGQDTEMDKNVIEQVADPLVHILRNAVDHGIESREKRTASGKPENGTIRLNAKYEGSEIWITVQDDGAGLNRERILNKAIERGLVKTDPSLLSDSDVWAFIFEPGFSTATTVSDVSGRGVGLDVVKKNLDRIRGRIDILTTEGQGTEFILAIPLTMAIIDGITVRVGSNRYSLPLNDIIEFVKITPAQISRTEKNEETVNIRTEFLPLIKLYEVFTIRDAITDPTEGIMIIVANNGRKACLLIDEVVGNQQIVVKSLSEYLGKVEGISGCSILGDGSVSFIIDTGRLMSLRID